MTAGCLINLRPIRTLVLLSVTLTALAQDTRSWKSLREDGIHDPKAPGIDLLQPPSAALGELPSDYVGNKVDWPESLASGFIAPRTHLYPGTEVQILDLDVIMENTAGAPMVRFPHRVHTEWLDCSNCHNEIFVDEVGANPVSMLAILSGEYCGVCHGAVAFPLIECNRCHSVSRQTFKGEPGAQYPEGEEP